MDPSAKRKQPPSNGSNDRRIKKSRGGSAGRWQTPHHKAKLEALGSKGLEVGNMGIWTTCVKGKERQAVEEMDNLCKEYGEKLFGIQQEGSAAEDNDDDDDIEASIKKEVESMKPAAGKPKDAIFQPMRMELDCLLFMRTKPPVDPVRLVQEICRDAKGITDKQQRRSRFINRFTPVTFTVKANETGVEEIARKVLAGHFRLAGDEGEQPTTAESGGCSYAIRPSFRAHNTLKRDDVIKKVASLIAPRHKVNLTSPDKVILIDIFQTFCGMSVVDGEWEALKRYNLHEIYLSALKGPNDAEEKVKEETTVQPETKSEEA